MALYSALSIKVTLAYCVCYLKYNDKSMVSYKVSSKIHLWDYFPHATIVISGLLISYTFVVKLLYDNVHCYYINKK